MLDSLFLKVSTKLATPLEINAENKPFSHLSWLDQTQLEDRRVDGNRAEQSSRGSPKKCRKFGEQLKGICNKEILSSGCSNRKRSGRQACSAKPPNSAEIPHRSVPAVD